MKARSGGPRLAASRPPAGLVGLDRGFSRLVDTDDALTGRQVTWHVLDTASTLDSLGVSPVGTIVAVHGNPTWSYLWRKIAQASVERAAAGHPAWRVVAPDQLEMGYSERTGVPRRLPDRVRDLDTLTTALDIDGPAVALGHDWGGVVAMGWAVDHSDQLAALALLNTAIHQRESESIPAPLRLALTPGVFDAATTLTPAFLETTLSLAAPSLSREVREGYRSPYRSRSRREGIGGFVADIPATAEQASRPELDRIAEGLRSLSVPSLLLWGSEDPIFSDRYLDDLVDRLPNSAVHRFEGAGHLIAEDVEYAPIVLQWLDEQSTDGVTAAATATNDAEAGDTEAVSTVARRPLWSELARLTASDSTALVELAPPGRTSPRRLSWATLSRRVDELAAGLSLHGVGTGDRVSLLVPPGADLTAALYACLRIGAIAVVADAGLGAKGLTRAIRGAQPDFIIGARTGLVAARALGWPGRRISTTRLPVEQRLALGVEASLPELARRGRGRALPDAPDADAVAAILFTSGSTGPAKGVVYTHRQLEALRDLLAERYEISDGVGLVAGFAPFALLGPALGARTATPDMDVSAPRTLTAAAVGDAVAAVDADILFLSPAAIANVVATADGLGPDHRAKLARVRLALSAGAPVSASLLTELATLLPSASLHTPYGMTEGLLMTDITLDEILETSEAAASAGGVCVGRPAPGVQVRIAPVGADGRAAEEATDELEVTGEIVVSAPHVKRNYDRLWLTDQAATRGMPARWHRTGDVGRIDSAGRLWVEGRLPHVVVSADGPVTPVGPEQRIEQLPAVTRAGVAGIGPRGTQQVVAVVETVPPAKRPSLASPDLADAVRAIAGVPVAAVLVVPRLPTDIRHNSKIDRTRLGRWAGDVLSGARMRTP